MDTTTTDAAAYAASCAKCSARGPLACKRCGCYAVAWRQTNAGRYYLGNHVIEDGGTGARAYERGGAGRRPHNCDEHAKYHAARTEMRQAYYWHHEQHRPAGR